MCIHVLHWKHSCLDIDLFWPFHVGSSQDVLKVIRLRCACCCSSKILTLTTGFTDRCLVALDPVPFCKEAAYEAVNWTVCTGEAFWSDWIGLTRCVWPFSHYMPVGPKAVLCLHHAFAALQQVYFPQPLFPIHGWLHGLLFEILEQALGSCGSCVL